ncbi:hypothetical protein KDH_41210 [Dictyobacter sp. S3.2.2.5]|uniref:Uncharacterized protein n=1 Tax=Dictyobacter halimunensis TaxID=3026934 RepID=A0ABQ6FY27_9CHLR|nr:hypothetical protein KDH_41210 [Dictyobacter sp. S3.2.2.5]
MGPPEAEAYAAGATAIKQATMPMNPATTSFQRKINIFIVYLLFLVKYTELNILVCLLSFNVERK